MPSRADAGLHQPSKHTFIVITGAFAQGLPGIAGVTGNEVVKHGTDTSA